MNRNPQYKDISGQRFGRWTALEPAGKTPDNHMMWRCRCDCGTERNVLGKDLRSGKSTSCGCISFEKFKSAVTKHGFCHHPLYTVWLNMKARCNNVNFDQYKNYGGRGIKICKEWESNPEAFIRWGLENGYEYGLQIDRIDNNMGYSPSNCHFVSAAENQNNKRTNRVIIYKGRKQTLMQWSRELGVPESRIRNRLDRGWSVKDALFKPPRR